MIDVVWDKKVETAMNDSKVMKKTLLVKKQQLYR